MVKKRVFVSFDPDHDKRLKEFVLKQTRLPNSPCEVIDASIKENGSEKDWESRVENRIKESDGVIVMVGPFTHRTPGVLKEVRLAKKFRKPIAQLIGYDSGDYEPVPGAGKLRSWGLDTLKQAFG
ncbi:MAG: TIR domain-containing protein [Candidatus Omnitrophica bacterium]|nr:TIR domain-containing protein [Candidatus Omnitrophota bacterium]